MIKPNTDAELLSCLLDVAIGLFEARLNTLGERLEKFRADVDRLEKALESAGDKLE